MRGDLRRLILKIYGQPAPTPDYWQKICVTRFVLQDLCYKICVTINYYRLLFCLVLYREISLDLA